MSVEPLVLVLAIALSLFVGVLMGTIGGGGSFVYLLLLLVVGGVPPHLAVGTGVILGVVGSSAATWRHLRNGAVRWRPAVALLAVAAPAALAGAGLTRVIPERVLLWLIVAALAVLGTLPLVTSWVQRGHRERAEAGPELREPAMAGAGGHLPAPGGPPPPQPAPARSVKTWLRLPTAGVLGAGTGAFGIAGGAPLASYLTGVERLPATTAVGTAMVVVTVTGSGAALAHIGLGQVSWAWVASLSAGAVLGAYAGAALMARIPHRPLAIMLGVLTLLTSIGLVIAR